jgi:hypothetical protein
MLNVLWIFAGDSAIAIVSFFFLWDVELGTAPINSGFILFIQCDASYNGYFVNVFPIMHLTVNLLARDLDLLMPGHRMRRKFVRPDVMALHDITKR